jgi:ABC-type Fe3+/spermidine/putrescine transport system ATPase subunit
MSMNKQQTSALNMARFIQSQSLQLLEKLSTLDLDDRADECERLHELAEALCRNLNAELESISHDG